MRHAGIALIGALALTVAMAAPRPGADVRADTPEALAVEAPQVAEVAAADVPPEATSTEDAIESEAENSAGSEPDVDGDRRRRYRRWYRNIYPGPIPTPADWEPPEGPVHIALQAGHWKADEAPDELSGLKDNGTSARGVPEWRANLAIARSAASMLRAKGYIVDVLPAVVPPSYRAHLFISIHADGSNDPKATGFRVASPRRDATGRASEIQELLERTYGEETGIRRLPDSTRRMRNYYAFNFRRYRHALHPMTIAVILETGFLTSESDWSVIVDDPDRAARGIVEAVTAYHVTALPETPEVVAQQLD